MSSRSPLRGEIEKSPLLRGEYMARLASRFVAIPSVNGENPEVSLAEEIRSELEPYGYRTWFVGDDASRPSIGAIRQDGEREGTVLLNGHLDTVPAEDPEEWRFPPFAGVIADGAVHGRGACDMKGGLAVQVAVAQWLSTRDGVSPTLHFAMGEERGEAGTEDLLGAGFVAPVGVVLEPTSLSIGVAQRGLVTLRVLVRGKSAHTATPRLGDNPIRHLPALLDVIRRLDEESPNRHELLGTAAWTPTVVRAGSIPSMIPDQCEVLVDRRMLPGEAVATVVNAAHAALQAALPDIVVEVSVCAEEGVYEPAEIPAGHPVVKSLSSALELFDHPARLYGTPYSSDVRHLVNRAGVAAVTWGPGNPTELHARDEFVEIADLELAARALAAFCISTAEPT